MNNFNEQVVRRAKKPKNLIIKIVAVLLLILVPATIFALAFVITAYLVYVAFFVFLGGIYAVWYVFSIQKVDFEYSVSGNELTVAKVIALRKRKNICKIQINEIERLEKDDTEIKKMRFLKTFIAARDIDAKDENYFAVFNSPAYGRCLLVFTPNEDILNGMKPHLNKNIVVQLFYKRKMS
ncbi:MULTISPECIES: hypothetical protein [Ruminococcus]|uniref:hypothetical protein n=1 Tax=Ruminococcus sp. TaxID=41978 RepID=UPI0015A47631|nr:MULTISPECIES: hypothetical protein [Ruminococcus]